MCDGWTDNINHTHIMNFLVYCHKGTVFWKSVDASDVDSRNTDYYFQLLDKVMEEVDLCLEDIGKKKSIHNLLSEEKMVTTLIYNHTYIVSLIKKYTDGRDIVRPSVTRFATQFLQLQAIVRRKEDLENMFNSEEFRKTKYRKEKKGPGYEARKIVMSRDFWSKANDILKVFEPIVKVLRLVDGYEKPTTGFIYDAIHRAKQAIQQNSRYHSKYNDIIDKRWKFMHFDLHSTSYFLNPQFQYGIERGKVVYKEIFNGTTNVIMKIEKNMDDQIKALNQLTLFREKSETFEWLPIIDTNDENVDDNSEINESGGGGLSPPSSNSDDGVVMKWIMKVKVEVEVVPSFPSLFDLWLGLNSNMEPL
ncbi:uncharacterized protein LOC127136075 [Lathyrus oleraceus]|uniref:uncharacterized protein LOC127136075 n=1 Tax=Pisum sativum TaxID=3888 RepID=UPI0021D25C92|nr:uncharacterized protein LOC127136075 [Pisum sativum]